MANGAWKANWAGHFNRVNGKTMNPIFAKRGCLSERELMQYLRGNISNQQRHDIENHLLDCPLCSAAVEGLAQSRNIEEVEDELEALQGLPLPGRPNPRLRATAWVNRAAAVALLLLLSYAGYRYYAATATERLFAEYFRAMPNQYITLRSPEGLAAEPELETALQFYSSGDFPASLPHFRNYLSSHTNDVQATLLAANACLQSGAARQAKDYLLPLESQAGQWKGQVQWYLALAYLKMGKTQPARQLLKAAAADKASAYSEAAAKLSSELK